MKRFALCLILSLCLAPLPSVAGVVGKCIDGLGLDCSVDKGDLTPWSGNYNQSGQDTQANVELALYLATGVQTSLNLYGASDDDPGLFNFYGFNSGATDLESSNSGYWALVNSGVKIAYISVKASGSFVLMDAYQQSSGYYSSMGLVSPNGGLYDVSHIRFWLDGDDIVVALPSSLGLLLLGLAGMRRRKQH